jgi:hypothetical protein
MRRLEKRARVDHGGDVTGEAKVLEPATDVLALTRGNPTAHHKGIDFPRSQNDFWSGLEDKGFNLDGSAQSAHPDPGVEGRFGGENRGSWIIL